MQYAFAVLKLLTYIVCIACKTFTDGCVFVDLLKAARVKGKKCGHYAISIQVSPKSMEATDTGFSFPRAWV